MTKALYDESVKDVEIPAGMSDEQAMSNMKKFCFICNFPFKHRTITQYRKRGNACTVCSKRSEAIACGKLIPEEADVMLADRLIQIQYPHIPPEEKVVLQSRMLEYLGAKELRG